MGHKVHPRILRTGIIYSWDSKWFAVKQDYSAMLREDVALRTYLRKKLRESAVDHIEIDRSPRAVTITIHTAKPGFVIGRGGTGVEDLKKALRLIIRKNRKLTGFKYDEKTAVNVNVVEISNPSLAAALVAQSMISDLERRLPFRRVLKQHLERVQKAGAKGVKVQVGGRLNGAEIARVEKLAWGSVPLHNLRADIDFASDFARTTAGTIGVKVWIYRGDVFEKERQKQAREAAKAAVAAAEGTKAKGKE